MARDEFFQNLRTAIGLVRPFMESDSAFPSGAIATQLARKALWLTPKAVEGYREEDFAVAPQPQQDELRAAVNEFVAFAEGVPSEGPSDEQYRRGLEQFERVTAAVRGILLPDWLGALEGLIGEVESWTQAKGWPSRRDVKRLEEKLLGPYDVPQLLFQADATPLLLDPVARFAPGSDGIVDLYVRPSYVSVMVARSGDAWWLHLERGTAADSVERKLWNEASFLEAIAWLRQQG